MRAHSAKKEIFPGALEKLQGHYLKAPPMGRMSSYEGGSGLRLIFQAAQIQQSSGVGLIRELPGCDIFNAS